MTCDNSVASTSYACAYRSSCRCSSRCSCLSSSYLVFVSQSEDCSVVGKCNFPVHVRGSCDLKTVPAYGCLASWVYSLRCTPARNTASLLLHPPQPIVRLVPAGLTARRPTDPKLATRSVRRIQCGRTQAPGCSDCSPRGTRQQCFPE